MGKLLSFFSVSPHDFPKTKKWIEENIEPTYEDNDLQEHLYSVDFEDIDEAFEGMEVPEYVKDFMLYAKSQSPDVAYIRFECL